MNDLDRSLWREISDWYYAYGFFFAGEAARDTRSDLCRFGNPDWIAAKIGIRKHVS